MKMVIEIDLEEIFNTVENSDWYERCYKVVCKKKPQRGNYEENIRWNSDREYAYHEMDKANDAVWSIKAALNMHEETQKRLRNAVRAKRHWEEKTKYMRIVPETMMKQFANYIFDDTDESQGFVVEKRWWEHYNDVYEREVIK